MHSTEPTNGNVTISEVNLAIMTKSTIPIILMEIITNVEGVVQLRCVQIAEVSALTVTVTVVIAVAVHIIVAIIMIVIIEVAVLTKITDVNVITQIADLLIGHLIDHPTVTTVTVATVVNLSAAEAEVVTEVVIVMTEIIVVRTYVTLIHHVIRIRHDLNKLLLQVLTPTQTLVLLTSIFTPYHLANQYLLSLHLQPSLPNFRRLPNDYLIIQR
jgi:hypothetical protein